MNISIVILVIAGLLILGVISIYNSLVNRKNVVEYAFSTIDVMLKKRRDLIPNLIGSVKEYMIHEKSLLENIVNLRNAALNEAPGSSAQFEKEGQISQALRKVLLVVENYPNLKASSNFLHLQASLNEIEEQISASRRAFNAAVLDYNNGLEMFPSNIFASAMNYKRKEPFEIHEEERSNIDVTQLFK